MTAPADVVVVGGGLPGLSAAVQLHGQAWPRWSARPATTWAAGSALTAATAFSSTGDSRWCCPPTPSSAGESTWRHCGCARSCADCSPRPTPNADGWPPRGTARRPQAGAAGFLLGHPRDSLALAALSLRDVLAPGPAISRADPGASTLTELRTRVSEATITSVLRPFLAGVFLDPSLGTSARLFHLIWRCFLRGGAALPEGGMRMLPQLLASGLPAGTCGPGRR